MKKSTQPILPSCEQVALRFKDIPCENAEGAPLTKCKSCDGSGTTCKGEKVIEVNPATPPKPYTPTSPVTSATPTPGKAMPSPVSRVPHVAARGW